jgi:hypothetical protein
MTEPTNLPEKVTELETKVRRLEIAALVIVNLIMIVYLLSR